MSGAFSIGQKALTMPVAVAKACLVFASTDDLRPHLSGLGLTTNRDGASCVACTDGHTSVTFPIGDGAVPLGANHGKYFPREYVEAAVKAAIAKRRDVVLSLAKLDKRYTYPPIHEVEPAPGIKRPKEFPGFDSNYLKRLAVVQAACDAQRAVLCSLTGHLNAARFAITGPAITASVTIMPRLR